jgi:hypothetical protein
MCGHCWTTFQYLSGSVGKTRQCAAVDKIACIQYALVIVVVVVAAVVIMFNGEFGALLNVYLV